MTEKHFLPKSALHLESNPSNTQDTFLAMCQALGIRHTARWQDRFGTSLREWATKEISRPIRVLSLFTGAGGLDIGFHDAGFSIGTMIEINPRIVETLTENCKKGRYLEGAAPVCIDIKEYHPPQDMTVDFIIGGPPCQPFSAAGRRMAGVSGTKDERGTLFKQYVRLVKQLSPQGFLFENVYGLAGAEDGKSWKSVKRAFARAGYKVFFRVLDAADYGVPQHRKRLFIVGTKNRVYAFPKPLFGPSSASERDYESARDALEGISVRGRAAQLLKVNGKYGALLDDIPPGLNYTFYTERMGHPRPIFAWRSKFFDFLYKADPQLPIRTLKANGGQYTGPFHWESRRFSVSELKRLQTIPDRYEIMGGQQAATEQIGNSVPPQLARILALSILNQIFDAKLPFDLPLYEENRSLKAKNHQSSLLNTYAMKAKTAIEKVKKSHRSKPIRPRSYTAYLSEDFGWTESRKRTALHVEFKPGSSTWQLTVSQNPKQHTSPKFLIQIKPVEGIPWGLKTKCIKLVGMNLTPQVFTGAWKALERELAEREIKADLVQLRGYYQYPAGIISSMQLYDTRNADDYWRVVKQIVDGVGVGTILSALELSKMWDIPRRMMLDYAMFLRALGYEVRNQNTNPQIPTNSYLIPYPFPTLTPLSVQLSKKLKSIYGDKT